MRLATLEAQYNIGASARAFLSALWEQCRVGVARVSREPSCAGAVLVAGALLTARPRPRDEYAVEKGTRKPSSEMEL